MKPPNDGAGRSGTDVLRLADLFNVTHRPDDDEIGEKVGLSQTPCQKRIQRLTETGALTGRVAIADPAKLGCGLTDFMGIEAPHHSSDWRAAFGKATDGFPKDMDVHRLAGKLDYMLRVTVSDMAALDGLCKRQTDALSIRNVTSHAVMERMKFTTAYPADTQKR